LPVGVRLTVIEEADRVLVAPEDDPSDWVCAFAKGGDFPAARWAQNMARTYNERLGLHDSEQDSEFTRLEAQQRQVQDQIDRFRAGDRLDRGEIHGRAVR
jgi:hypothetical protein